MSIASAAIAAETELRRARRTVLILAIAQALFNATISVQIWLGGLVGYMLAENKALATVPVSMVVTGTALATIPAAMLMRRVGRRRGFMVGGVFGLVGSSVGALAVYLGDFWLFAFGLLLFGAYSAFAQYYRFAAADASPGPFKAKAISYVLAGGIVAGYLGIEMGKHTKDLFEPYLFLGPFVGAAVLCLLAILTQTLIHVPNPTAAELQEKARPLSEILRIPAFGVAVASGMIGYAMMSLIMTATPLAMLACGLPETSSGTVIQWHIVGMFGPSFFTGHLINRFGVLRIIMTGAATLLACVAIALSGVDFLNFWVGLVLLGIGWNFMYIGGTSLLTSVYRPSERTRAQAFNDFAVFGAVAIASLSSGKLLDAIGWSAVLWAAVPFILIAAAAVSWLMLVRRRLAMAG